MNSKYKTQRVAAGNTDLENLEDLWNSAVEDGLIVNEVEAAISDRENRWNAGDRLNVGVRLHDGKAEYFAANVTTGQLIEAAVEERFIEGTGFLCQFNGYRALRPGGERTHLGRQPDISATPADCRFYCGYPERPLSLLTRRPLSQLSLRHWHWNIYYNAFPFDVSGHFLCVPAAMGDSGFTLRHFPQKLTSDFLEDLLFLRTKLPLMFFFSSLHAGASVNHIHIQSVFHRSQLPLERAECIAYRGFTVLTGYLAEAFVFSASAPAEALHECVARLEQQDIPFNLLVVGEKVFLFPRNPEHEVVEEFPGSVLAGPDLAGKIITTDRAAYEHADRGRLQDAFSKACISARKLIDGW
jgi:hypothetical protein